MKIKLDSKHRLRYKSTTYKILHFIGKAFLFLFILILMLIGFTQTAFFRNLLKDKVTQLAQSELKGTIKIGSIYGTLFSSITLREFDYEIDSIKFLQAKTIHLSINPLTLLRKKITINKIYFEELKINLVQFESGKWITQGIVKRMHEPDTTKKAKFDYDIEIKQVTFNNCQFHLKKNATKDDYFNYSYYPYLNTNDFYLSNFNLSLSAKSIFNHNDYELLLENLSFKTNINNFSLIQLRLNIDLKDNKLTVSPFILRTHRTNLKLNFSADEINLFDTTLVQNISQKNFYAEVIANSFDFDDLKTFLPEVSMLSGKVKANLTAEGSLDNLLIKNLYLGLDSSDLNADGTLSNILGGKDMTIQARIFNSKIFMNDVSELLPLYSIPSFQSEKPIQIKAEYKGKPTAFNTKFLILHGNGLAEGSANFNFQLKVPTYKVDLLVQNFDFSPLIKLESRLNSSLQIEGKGFNPKEINSNLSLEIKNSRLAGNKIDSLTLKVNAKNNIFDLSLKGKFDTVKLDLLGQMNFQEEDLPKYNFVMNGSNIDLARNFYVKELPSNLNFSAWFRGKSFDFDDMVASAQINIFESSVNNVEIPESKVIIDINHESKESKVLSFQSDFLDWNISGTYKLNSVDEALQQTIKVIKNEIDKKIKAFKGENDSIEIDAKKFVKGKGEGDRTKKPNVLEPFYAKYNIKFKDFNLINIFLKNIKLNLDGEVNGEFSSKGHSINFSSKSSFQDFWLIDYEKSYRLRNAQSEITFNVDDIYGSNDLKFSFKSDAEKILVGSQFEHLSVAILFNKNVLGFSFLSIIDSTIFTRGEGNFTFIDSAVIADINKMTMEYKKYKLTNEGPIQFSFTKDNVRFNKFILRRKNERIKLNGEIGFSGHQNLVLTAQDFELNDIVMNFFPSFKEKIEGKVLLHINISGNAKSPIINSQFELINLSIGNDKLGNLRSEINYQEKVLNISSYYIDSLYYGKDLSIQGSLPIDLSFYNVKDRLIKNKEINFTIDFENFNLQPTRALIDFFSDIQGSLNGEIKVGGTIGKPELTGEVKSNNVIFVVRQNNLKYSSDLQILFDQSKILLKQFNITNLETRKRGKLYSTGEVEFDERGIKNLSLTSKGSLLVLGNESKGVSPNVYGDLFLEIISPINIVGSYNSYSLTGEIGIRESNIIIPPLADAYSDQQESFVYNYVDYGTQIDSLDLAFYQAEQALRGNRKTKSKKSDDLLSKIDVRLRISVKKNVNLTVIFNKELNQRLYADLKGDIIYNIVDDQPSVQGEILLSEDSYLVFYQKFMASGKIRFEREISNPYLEVTAVYSNYYIVGDTLDQKVKDVKIKLKLKGTVNELGKNLVSNKENIEVSIDGVIDQTKDASDVVAFILLGKFKDDLTAEDKTKAASIWGETFQTAASSLLGSVIQNFANSILGDVLRNVEFRRVGEETKFSLEGRVKDVRFKVGGGTDVFQNFALANIQLEYPISEKLFLRLIRKQASLQTAKPSEMINEVGLKYKVEF